MSRPDSPKNNPVTNIIPNIDILQKYVEEIGEKYDLDDEDLEELNLITKDLEFSKRWLASANDKWEKSMRDNANRQKYQDQAKDELTFKAIVFALKAITKIHNLIELMDDIKIPQGQLDNLNKVTDFFNAQLDLGYSIDQGKYFSKIPEINKESALGFTRINSNYDPKFKKLLLENYGINLDPEGTVTALTASQESEGKVIGVASSQVDGSKAAHKPNFLPKPQTPFGTLSSDEEEEVEIVINQRKSGHTHQIAKNIPKVSKQDLEKGIEDINDLKKENDFVVKLADANGEHKDAVILRETIFQEQGKKPLKQVVSVNIPYGEIKDKTTFSSIDFGSFDAILDENKQQILKQALQKTFSLSDFVTDLMVVNKNDKEYEKLWNHTNLKTKEGFPEVPLIVQQSKDEPFKNAGGISIQGNQIKITALGIEKGMDTVFNISPKALKKDGLSLEICCKSGAEPKILVVNKDGKIVTKENLTSEQQKVLNKFDIQIDVIALGKDKGTFESQLYGKAAGNVFDKMLPLTVRENSKDIAAKPDVKMPVQPNNLKRSPSPDPHPTPPAQPLQPQQQRTVAL